MFVFSVFGLVVGVLFFLYGFRSLRRKRAIQNLPASTIRSIALGTVKIRGRAEDWNVMTSPMAGRKCVAYKYMVQKETEGSWKTIASGDSFAFPFRVNDGTGTITVYPKKSEFLMEHPYKYMTEAGTAFPANLDNLLGENGSGLLSLTVTQTFKVKEWIIAPGQNVYVLGQAKRMNISSFEQQAKMSERIAELKEDPERMAMADLDKDGLIDMEEWDLARGRLAGEVRAQADDYKRSKNFNDQVAIEKGGRGELFIISDRGQEALIGQMTLKSLAGIFGGAALILGSLPSVVAALSAK